MNKQTRCSPEVRERAVRLVFEHKAEYESQSAAIGSVASKIIRNTRGDSDELIALDIDATRQEAEPDYRLIERLAAECRMPFCYGGGIRNPEQARRIIGLGVEKVALSSAAVASPELVAAIADDLGSQSVVAILDVKKKRFGLKYEVWTHNAQNNTGEEPVELAKKLQSAGVGEIVINSITNDGMMTGYDLKILQEVRSAVSVPLTALGGAGSLGDIKDVLAQLGVVGAAAGNLFVFKGAYKSVLINYPSEADRQSLYSV